MLVHRDYELPEPASIETRPGAEIAFSNPGGLTQNLERRIAIDKDGRFKLSESLTDQRNPALCDIFFGISAMERAGTGLIDACQLMTECGGNSAFRSEEHTSELQYLMRISYAVFCLQNKKNKV